MAHARAARQAKSIDLSRADLNLLVLFEAVLKERHVGRAATRLNLSPSAVSHGLGRLRRLLSDPLFLRTPKGVVPTERATKLAEPIADILARVRTVVSTAEPFDAATSTRRFTIGAPDAVSAVLLPPLLEALARRAPRIDIAMRQLLPPRTVMAHEHAWQPAFDELDARTTDIALIPTRAVPARFAARRLYDEDFVIASRERHPYSKSPTLQRFCHSQHVLVSLTGDPHGFVDAALAERGLTRRIALTVPSFMMALPVLADTDFIAALPRQLVAMHGPRFGVVGTEAPIALPSDPIHAVASRAALMDAGVAWLSDVLQTVTSALRTRRKTR
jgi:DNA-binding transcriptional LysR family regulator